LLRTAHGEVETPVFMPVGTAGAVKGITPQQLKESGAGIVLANTYHLMLRPGVETVEKLGGLHRLMAWDRPILTDSGGYQVFSLSTLAKVDDDGVEFASHIDGARIYLDAEIATEIQNRLGADIIMCFDQCTPSGVDAGQLEKAVERSIAWAERCKKAHTNSSQMLFGIVQGGTNLDLRTSCAAELVKMDFDGYALGGLSVGEGHDEMIRTVAHTAQLLPKDKPRYLMGVGTPKDSRRSEPEWTCSTASCPPETDETPLHLPKTAPFGSETARTRTTPALSNPAANATAVKISAGARSDISSTAAKC